jgi:hypothetical protein
METHLNKETYLIVNENSTKEMKKIAMKILTSKTIYFIFPHLLNRPLHDGIHIPLNFFSLTLQTPDNGSRGPKCFMQAGHL